MAKFVIHKKGFFYTDESFELDEGAKGSITGTFDSLKEAEIEKEKLEINSIQKLGGMNAVDFIFNQPNYDEMYGKLESFYQSEFNITIEDKHYFNFPESINTIQATFLKDTMGLSFHDIVEYSDDEELNPEDFNLEEDELGEF